jgi:hypothetical protein
MSPCEICGADNFENGLAKGRHMKAHNDAEPGRTAAPKPSSLKPAILTREHGWTGEEWRQNPNPVYGQRSITMLRPICKTCKDADNVPLGWFLDCPHDPYVSVVPVEVKVPRYEDLPDGRKRQTGVDTFLEYRPRPNIVDIALTPKINGGQGVKMARGKGFILPSELRSPHFPAGIADACQFRDCRKQEGLKQYTTEEETGERDWGTYCRKMEAQLVWKVEHPDSGALEIGWDESSRNKRRAQLAAAAI